jgi:undecaprenyl diphosphate synthase
MAHDPVEYCRSVGVDPARLPRHVAIIMDGNGRWANERGWPRTAGHAKGADTVRTTVTECCKLGLQQLTLYSLSIENWKRPKEELDFLMALLKQYLLEQRSEILDQNIRFRVIGRRVGLPDEVLHEIDETTRLSEKNTGLTLCLAINYGSRTEILDALRSLAEQVKRGEILPEQLEEEHITNALYTAGMPDPDLLIRTAGELRVSNYLLWQISYAELWVTPFCWPDFTSAILHDGLREFAQRNRKFGSLNIIQGASEGTV